MLYLVIIESKFTAADFTRKQIAGIETCLFEMLGKQMSSKTESKK